MRTFLKHYPLSISAVLVICYLSFFTPPQNDVPTIPNLDKVVHLCMYGGLTTLIWSEYFLWHKGIKWMRLIIGGIVFPILMSGLIEIGQSTLTTTRSGDWLDFVANTSGVVLACFFTYYVIQPIILKHKKEKK